jgi:hypothetical protein
MVIVGGTALAATGAVASSAAMVRHRKIDLVIKPLSASRPDVNENHSHLQGMRNLLPLTQATGVPGQQRRRRKHRNPETGDQTKNQGMVSL